MKKEMIVAESPGSIERFHKTKWRFQQTFRTPLQDLKAFVKTILSAHEGLQNGCVTIDQIVFQPTHLTTMLAKYSTPVQFERDWSIRVAGQHKIEQLLETALSDWADFTFVPTPETFVMYADHDEYVTFYADAKSNLDLVVEALSANGFTKVSEYERNF
jgi:hypothetical protein